MTLKMSRARVPVDKLLPSVEDEAIPARELHRRGKVILRVFVGRNFDAGKTAFLRDGLPKP
jgi:hypothetical protein